MLDNVDWTLLLSGLILGSITPYFFSKNKKEFFTIIASILLGFSIQKFLTIEEHVDGKMINYKLDKIRTEDMNEVLLRLMVLEEKINSFKNDAQE